MGIWQENARLRLMRKEQQTGRGKPVELEQQEAGREREKIPWHIIEGHFGAKLLIDKSTNLPGRR